MFSPDGRLLVARIILSLISVASALLGCFLVGISFWVDLNDSYEPDLRKVILDTRDVELNEYKEDFRIGLAVTFLFAYGFGLATAAIGIIGSVGTFLKRRFITGFYVSLTISMIFIHLAAVIYLAVNKSSVLELVKEYVILTSEKYGMPDNLVIRERFDCCGIQQGPNPDCPSHTRNCVTAVSETVNFWIGAMIVTLSCSIVAQFVAAVAGAYFYTVI